FFRGFLILVKNIKLIFELKVGLNETKNHVLFFQLKSILSIYPVSPRLVSNLVGDHGELPIYIYPSTLFTTIPVRYLPYLHNRRDFLYGSFEIFLLHYY